jgi:L-ribulose-5-phosphate 4-epimerase
MRPYDSAKKLIVETARQLTKKGYLMATGGNLSVRVAGQNVFAITPSNYDYMKMVPDDICILDLDLNPLASSPKGEWTRKPSVESAMHAAIYQTRPDVNAVVHTHQVYASTLALIKKPIPALFDEQARFLGSSVKIIPYAPSGTVKLRDVIAKHVCDHNNAYLMQNHGALCLGHDLERAAHNVEVLEKCALTYLLALCTGNRVTRLPAAARQLAFTKLRQDQEKVERGNFHTGGE